MSEGDDQKPGFSISVQRLIDDEIFFDELNIETRLAQGNEFKEQIRVISSGVLQPMHGAELLRSHSARM